MKKDLVIYSTQRSGTHFLSSLLHSGAKIKGLGEVFITSGTHQKFVKYVENECNYSDTNTVLRDEELFYDFFERFRAHSIGNNPDREFSLIIMYNQARRFSYSALARLLADRNVIHLVRRNVLRTHVSDFINWNRLKPSHSWDSAADIKETRGILLPTENLVKDLENRTAEIRIQRHFVSQFDHVELHYENIVENDDVLLELAERFDFTASSEFSSRLKRTNPQLLSEILENFDAVQSALLDTEYFDMLIA